MLARMIAVPRENFPAVRQGVAGLHGPHGDDRNGGAISPPRCFLRQAAAGSRALARTDRVLVVEGGTGYLAELLRPLVAELETASADDAAAGRLATPLRPITLIVIDGAIEQLPEALVTHLGDEGRIVVRACCCGR